MAASKSGGISIPVTITLGCLLLAGGFTTAGYFISQTLYNSNVGVNSANVRGLAERRVKSNIAYWTMGYSVATDKKSQIKSLYARSEAARDLIISELLGGGLIQSEITSGVVNYHTQDFRDRQQKLIDQRHTLHGIIEVEATDVDRVKHLRAELNKLIAQGIDLENNAPRYLFTQLNDIKPAMLRDATTNARIAANEFADNAGVSVGSIKSARQGNFNIRDVGASYADDGKIDKIVRVVTSVDFYLVN